MNSKQWIVLFVLGVVLLIVVISLVGVIVVSNIDIEAIRATATAAAGG